MEALVTTFVAAFLSGWGAKTQLIVALLVARGGRPGLVLAGLLAAALASNLIASFAGVMIGAALPPRAASLMVALALLLGGLAAFVPRGAPSLGSMKLPLLLVAAILCLELRDLFGNVARDEVRVVPGGRVERPRRDELRPGVEVGRHLV